MLKRFERVVILIGGSLVAGLVVLAILSPPKAWSPQAPAIHSALGSPVDIDVKQYNPARLIRINTPGAITEDKVGNQKLEPN